MALSSEIQVEEGAVVIYTDVVGGWPVHHHAA